MQEAGRLVDHVVRGQRTQRALHENMGGRRHPPAGSPRYETGSKRPYLCYGQYQARPRCPGVVADGFGQVIDGLGARVVASIMDALDRQHAVGRIHRCASRTDRASQSMERPIWNWSRNSSAARAIRIASEAESRAERRWRFPTGHRRSHRLRTPRRSVQPASGMRRRAASSLASACRVPHGM